MSDTKDKEKTSKDEENKGKKTLSLGKGTLSLKSSSGGSTRNVTPGRGRQSSNVAVEVRRKRSARPSDKASGTGEADETKELQHLTSEEREARIRALEEAREYSRLKKEKQETLEKERALSEAEKKEEAALEKQREKELEELQKIEAEEQWKRQQERQKAGPEKQPSGQRAKSKDDVAAEDLAEEESYRSRMKKAARRPARSGGEKRRSGKLTVTQVLNEDYDKDRGLSLAAQKRARQKAKMAAPGTGHDAPSKVTREVIVPETITVQELANRMAERGGDLVKELMKMGVMATINQTIDADTAELLVHEFGHKVKRVTEADIEEGLEGAEDEEATLTPRPPVVTIMGHVDHGKTSLLDALRATDVVAGEAGGITQHIGAYQVTMQSGAKITFLDTPGHAAFTEMRARGANITDIVVIVVAANDSIMPQTIEAINHAKAAKVPVIIAINKVDLPDADPQKVKNDLLSHEIIIEEMGGDVLCIEVSALKKQNLDKLEEMILLQAELLDLKANPERLAAGTVVESKLEQGRGNVATILIEKGTLKIGDVFVVGSEWGKVRALINDHGKNIDKAVPGQPVEVLGLDGAPEAGDRLIVVGDEAKARDVAEYRQRKKREAASVLAAGSSSLEEMLEAAKQGEKQQLAIVIKGDVHGSVEAIIGSLKKIEEENEDVIVNILHSGVGAITESDVTLANASKGLIIGFNVRANAQARELSEREGVEIRYYNVIYNVIDDAKNVLSGMLEPTRREEYLGQAEIRQVFRITKVGNVAGCMVTDGSVRRGSKVRLLRDNVVIHEGTLKTLKRYQDEVKEVKEGTECGMAFENYDDIKENDVIECYDIVEEERTLA